MAKKTKREMIESLVALRQPEDRKLEVFSELYAPQMKAFENSPRAKMMGGVSDEDKLVLGECLTNYMLESNNQANLGLDPLLALSVITSVFGNSVLPLFTSEQPLQDKQGVIYFENIVAKSNRGNVIDGKLLNAGASAKEVYPLGYASDGITGIAVTNTAGEEVQLAVDGTNITKIRPTYLAIVDNGRVVATDDGKGNIIGAGVTGTVDYVAGKVKVTMTPTGTVTANVATDYELDGTLIPRLNVEYDSKVVKAHTYALQADTSILASFISKKRLGVDANKRAIEVLQQQILREITNEAIKKIQGAVDYTAATRFSKFNTMLPPGVSLQAHYNSYNLTHARIQNQMAEIAGRGNFGAMLAGTEFCEFLTGLNEFKQEGTITDDPSYFGTLGGRYGNVKVVRCPQLHKFVGTDTQKIADEKKSAYCVYQNSKVDAAAVFAPFMPIVVTNDIPVSDNLLQRRSLIASMATTEVVVDKYLQKVQLVEEVRA